VSASASHVNVWSSRFPRICSRICGDLWGPSLRPSDARTTPARTLTYAHAPTRTISLLARLVSDTLSLRSWGLSAPSVHTHTRGRSPPSFLQCQSRAQGGSASGSCGPKRKREDHIGTLPARTGRRPVWSNRVRNHHLRAYISSGVVSISESEFNKSTPGPQNMFTLHKQLHGTCHTLTIASMAPPPPRAPRSQLASLRHTVPYSDHCFNGTASATSATIATCITSAHSAIL
jgi:hypothetical protein